MSSFFSSSLLPPLENWESGIQDLHDLDPDSDPYNFIDFILLVCFILHVRCFMKSAAGPSYHPVLFYSVPLCCIAFRFVSFVVLDFFLSRWWELGTDISLPTMVGD